MHFWVSLSLLTEMKGYSRLLIIDYGLFPQLSVVCHALEIEKNGIKLRFPPLFRSLNLYASEEKIENLLNDF